MKRSKTVFAAAMLLCLLGVLAGCGNKGDLTRPKPSAQVSLLR